MIMEFRTAVVTCSGVGGRWVVGVNQGWGFTRRGMMVCQRASGMGGRLCEQMGQEMINSRLTKKSQGEYEI